MFKKEQLPLAI